MQRATKTAANSEEEAHYGPPVSWKHVWPGMGGRHSGSKSEDSKLTSARIADVIQKEKTEEGIEFILGS